MMHTTCLNSSLSFRCTNSQFDLPNCFFRFETNPLLISSSFTSSCCYCCCYCCCCANSSSNNSSIYYNSLPRISPSFSSNGLRQSTLIQFSPTKRLIFQGRRRQFCSSNSGFSSVTDSDRNYYHEKLKSLKDRRKLGKGRYGCWALEDKRKEGFFSDEIDDDHVDDVEILLDLLTEEVGLENLGVKDRKRVEKNDRFTDRKRIEEVGLEHLGVKDRKRIEKNDRFTDRKRIEDVGLEHLGVKDRKRVEKKDGFAAGKTKNVGSVKRDSRIEDEVVEVRSRKKDDRRVIDERKEEKTGGFVEGVNRERSRRDGSSCSSYYSVSSMGDFESENDVEVKQDGFFVRGESSNEYKDDRKSDRYEEIGKEESGILKKNAVEMYYGNQEWRKKSEKKLNEESSHHQSHVSVNTERNSQHDSEKAETVTNQSQSRTKHTRLMEKNQYRDTENKSNTSVQKLTSKRRSETAEKDSRVYEYKRQSNVVLESSRIQEIDMREASSSSSSREARIKNREENVTEVSGEIVDRREEKLQRIDSRVKSQQISDTRIANTKNTRVSSQEELHFGTSGSSHEARIKNLEENSTEVSGLVEDRREEKLERMNQLTMLQDSRVKSQQISETSDTRITNTENTRFSSRQELHLDASSSAEKVTTSEKDRRAEKLERMNQSTTVKDSRVKSQQSSETSDTRVTNTENTRVLSRQSDIRKEKQELRLDTPSSAEKVTTSRRTTKASSFHVGMPKEASSTYKALKLIPEPKSQETGADGASKSGSRISKPAHEHSSQHFETITDEGGVSHEDVIYSADQQQRSSSHFVGEFVKEAKHELSTSEVQEEKKTREEEFVYEDTEQYELKTPGEDGSGNSNRKDGVRGPSDEMWHETTASIQPPSETDAPDNTSSSGNGELIKKSGRSLWNVIGDVVRFRWASPRSETHASQSGGGKGLSNQSTGSEAWFSGHEPEESNDDDVKTGSAKGRSHSKKEPSDPLSSKDSPLLLSSSSSNANQGSSSKHMSPSVIRMRRSPAVKITSGTDETEQPVPKMTETPPVADASASGKMVIVDRSKDEVPKRRKLGRADQVAKDRFDEWEEAYNVETEQRKNDERFMREALLEAKKAADFWEVPVGAVLVQDGEIIARGYNLVEELRDSTAHAEMICIREASNNLRSWRLSGTTLYVTLEPCAMCAGAILQARIDTVVWGAPNKLLGADGSWIRLFPDGDGGSGSSDKPAAPVHPFHPNMMVRRGVLSSECADVMQQFFQLRRKKKEKRVEAEPATPPPSASCLPVATHHHRSKLFSKMHDAFSIMFCL